MVVLLHRCRRTVAFLLPLFCVKLNEVKSTEAITPRVQRGWRNFGSSHRSIVRRSLSETDFP
jgi:hypothetical protein